MGSIGIGSGLINSPKQRQPGPPFSTASANNGLSVDPVTGKIVLGNDFGSPQIAALQSIREIPLNGFTVEFTGQDNGLGQLNDVSIADGQITITQDTNVFSNPNLTLFDNANSTFCTIQYGAAGAGGIAAFVSPSGINLTTQNTLLNVPSVQVTGGQLTGALQNSAFVIGQPWNTTGNPVAFSMNIGDTASGAASRLMELQTNNIDRFVVTKAGNVTSAGTLTTADPGSGAGSWLLGAPVVAASVFDNTQYLEVKINGVVRKIALVV